MTPPDYVPHVSLLLESFRISLDRLRGKAKIAIDTEVLRELLQALVATLPFSEEFYLQTYPDVAEGQAEGRIPDLRRHMVEQGYFEGRLGAAPAVDPAYYLALYPDVQAAIDDGRIESAAQHYVLAGAAEGRIPNAALQDMVNHWNRILRDVRGPGG